MAVNLRTDTVLSWMKSKDIVVPRDWVSACLEWISTEGSVKTSEESLRRMVYEQWLFTDLRDFDIRTFPSSILDDKFTLKGNYCIQMDSILDISQSRYSQLLAKNGKKSDDVIMSTNQRQWEKKPARLLMMKLSDGIEEISALETQYIKCLNPSLPSGTKLRIKGPLKCRRGVILLTGDSIDLLGGEVDEPDPSNDSDMETSDTGLNSLQSPRQIPQQYEVENDDFVFVSTPTATVRKSVTEPSTVKSNSKSLGPHNSSYSSIATSNPSNFFSHSSSHSAENEQVKRNAPVCGYGKSGRDVSSQSQFANAKVSNGSATAQTNASFFDLKANFNELSPPQMSDRLGFSKASSSNHKNMSESAPIAGTVSTEATSCKNDLKFLCSAKKYIEANGHLKKLEIRVKAVVTTLLSKLKRQAHAGWSLKACICDGSDVLEVDFSHDVLLGLIGFEVPVFDSKNSPFSSVDDYELKRGLENCRSKIMSACHYMHLELLPSLSGVHGIVTKIEFLS